MLFYFVLTHFDRIDRYTCGDEYIVPSSEFDFDLDDEEEYDESLELFLNFRSLNVCI